MDNNSTGVVNLQPTGNGSVEDKQPSSLPASYPSWNSVSGSESDRDNWGDSSLLLTNGSTPGDAKRKMSESMMDESETSLTKKKFTERAERFSKGKDYYCWCCHKEKANVSCVKCPRSYHFKCLSANSMLDKGESNPKILNRSYMCYNCKVESGEESNLSKALKAITAEELNGLLIHAIDAVKTVSTTIISEFYEYNVNCFFRQQTRPFTRLWFMRWCRIIRTRLFILWT